MTHRDPYKLYPHDHVMKFTIIPLIPRFITPNMITILRMISIPFVLYFLMRENFAIGAPLFIAVAFTDAIDGSLARLRKQITAWGTFYDPVADKLLIGTVVLFVVIKHINLIFGLLIVIVEALIILGGYFRKSKGQITTANAYGKIKMALQVTGVTMLLIALWAGFDLFIPVSIGTLSLAIIFAIISMFTYGL
jgi:CDP-diacylglycerol---glycerol-3-phosphate 3-phosphatidyltransferase